MTSTLRLVLLVTSLVSIACASQVPDLKGTLVVANQKADSAFLIRLRDGAVVKRIATGHGPHEAAVSADGKLAAISNYLDEKPSVLIVDVASGQPVATISMGDCKRPHGMQFVDATHLLVTSEQTQRLATLDVAKKELQKTVDTKGRLSHMVVLSPDHCFAYTSNVVDASVSKIDLATGTVSQTRVGKGCEGIGISPDGKAVWVGNREDQSLSVIDTSSMKVTKTIPCPGLPYRVAFTPNGKYALVANPAAGSLDVFDAKKGTLVKRIEAEAGGVKFGAEGGAPAIGGIAVHPGGRYVFCTVINASSVAVFDLQKMAVVAKYEAATSPDGIAFSPVEVARDAGERGL